MQGLNVYEIAPGRFALGNRDNLALAVVQRIAIGPGRPSYIGVRGRRPKLDARYARVPASSISKLLRTELARVARFN